MFYALSVLKRLYGAYTMLYGYLGVSSYRKTGEKNLVEKSC